MIRFTRLAVIAVATALITGGLGTAVASPPGSLAARSGATGFGTLTIQISTSAGKALGSVAVAPLNKTCSKATCTFKRIKAGSKLTLTETPVDPVKRPFEGWTVNKKAVGASPTLTFTMRSGDRVVGGQFTFYGTMLINITATSQVWGIVKLGPALNPTGATIKFCNHGTTAGQAQCGFQFPVGTQLFIGEAPTDVSTWPFCDWTVNGVAAGTPGDSEIHITMGSSETVNAKYDPSC